MTHRPASIDDLRQVVATTPRLSIRGGGTKPGLAGLLHNRSVIDMVALAGVTEHTPEECTFTALAGTRIAETSLFANGARDSVSVTIDPAIHPLPWLLDTVSDYGPYMRLASGAEEITLALTPADLTAVTW